jgi:thiol:disulfide interchange protein DsbD
MESDGENEIGQFTWREYNAGLLEGKNYQKPIIVDLYADWCGPCKQMDIDTYQHPDVIEMILEEFVPVKVNTDTQPALAYQYNVQYIPTIVYLTPNGFEIHRTIGYRSAAQLLDDMHTALQNM